MKASILYNLNEKEGIAIVLKYDPKSMLEQLSLILTLH